MGLVHLTNNTSTPLWTLFFCGSMLVTVMVRGIIFWVACPFIYFILVNLISQEHLDGSYSNLAQMFRFCHLRSPSLWWTQYLRNTSLECFFFPKCGIAVLVDLSKNWLDFGVQRSKVTLTYFTQAVLTCLDLCSCIVHVCKESMF